MISLQGIQPAVMPQASAKKTSVVKSAPIQDTVHFGASNANITYINGTADFQREVLDADKPVIVDFYADWCGPCKRLAPAFEQLADKLNTNIKFVKVKLDSDDATVQQENQALAQQYGVQGIPNISMFNNGQKTKEVVGLNMQGIVDMLNENLPADKRISIRQN